jgi:hypothetical protein
VNCALAAHQSTCLAAINPESVSSITFTIQGPAHGARIDENTGVISPGSMESGSISVRAAATILPSCYDESVFLIKPHPTSINNTAATVVSGPYGGTFVHTFDGTGGSLDAAQISEDMQAGTNPFGITWAGVPYPGEPNVWTLDASGTMSDFDKILTDDDFVDVNDFLPKPPKAGLPAIWNTPQTLYWFCPLCNEWEPFMFVGVTRALQQGSTNIVFVTTDNGVLATQPYIGPELAP